MNLKNIIYICLNLKSMTSYEYSQLIIHTFNYRHM